MLYVLLLRQARLPRVYLRRFGRKNKKKKTKDEKTEVAKAELINAKVGH